MPDSEIKCRISVATAARTIFGVAPETAWRWALRGVRGVRLESTIIGGRRYTSREACERFLAQLNGEPEPPPAPPERTSRAEAAARALDEAGIR